MTAATSRTVGQHHHAIRPQTGEPSWSNSELWIGGQCTAAHPGSNLARTQRLVERLETGMLGINTGVVSNAAAPFGGLKNSGLGREGGIEGIAEYLSTTYTLVSR